MWLKNRFQQFDELNNPNWASHFESVKENSNGVCASNLTFKCSSPGVMNSNNTTSQWIYWKSVFFSSFQVSVDIELEFYRFWISREKKPATHVPLLECLLNDEIIQDKNENVNKPICNFLHHLIPKDRCFHCHRHRAADVVIV